MIGMMETEFEFMAEWYICSAFQLDSEWKERCFVESGERDDSGGVQRGDLHSEIPPANAIRGESLRLDPCPSARLRG